MTRSICTATDTMRSVVDLLQEFSEKFGHMRLREAAYSHLLFNHLGKELGDRLLVELGLHVDFVNREVDERHRGILKKYLPKARDLYPDLWVFKNEILDLGADELCRTEKLTSASMPLLMCEWKFTASFPSMSRKLVVQDAVKLQILSEYFQQRWGMRPGLLQIIFNFDCARRTFSDRRIKGWFASETLRESIPDVVSISIRSDGEVVPLAGEMPF